MKGNNLKNIEQLRYRIVLELQKMSNRSNNDDGTLGSYFVASIVDFFVGNGLQDALKSAIENKFILSVVYFLMIPGLMLLFIAVSKMSQYICKKRNSIKKVRGKAESKDLDYIKANIDKFDNTACNCLLICKEYIVEYKKENKDAELRQFYFNEVVHYYEKASFIFNIILLRKEVYVDNENKMEFEPIRPYRIENFINISNSIVEFLSEHYGDNISDELKKDILKLSEQAKEFVNCWNS